MPRHRCEARDVPENAHWEVAHEGNVHEIRSLLVKCLAPGQESGPDVKPQAELLPTPVIGIHPDRELHEVVVGGVVEVDDVFDET